MGTSNDLTRSCSKSADPKRASAFLSQKSINWSKTMFTKVPPRWYPRGTTSPLTNLPICKGIYLNPKDSETTQIWLRWLKVHLWTRGLMNICCQAWRTFKSKSMMTKCSIGICPSKRSNKKSWNKRITHLNLLQFSKIKKSKRGIPRCINHRK